MGQLMPMIFPHCLKHLASSSDSGMGSPASAELAQLSSDLPNEKMFTEICTHLCSGKADQWQLSSKISR